MNGLSKWKAKILYKRNMKHLSKQLQESQNLYAKNEKRIEELNQLIEKEKRERH